MKVMIVCSTAFYDKIAPIKQELEKNGHHVITPNCYDAPVTSDDHKKMTDEEYLNFFREMYEAFMNNKKIFMLNDYPDNMLLDEIKGFNPIIINEDISKIQ